jgi:hypothetical protein
MISRVAIAPTLPRPDAYTMKSDVRDEYGDAQTDGSGEPLIRERPI